VAVWLALLAGGIFPSAAAAQSASAGSRSEPAAVSDSEVVQLYQRHCAACHGERGDGRGPAARYVFPKPRNFRAGTFKLVSTVNGVASQEDLMGVLLRGVPGSAMQSWKSFSEAERLGLVRLVSQFAADGVRQTLLSQLDEVDPSAEALQRIVRQRLRPGPLLPVPEPPELDGDAQRAALQAGRRLYLKQNCQACRGDDGRGVLTLDLVDDNGWQVWSRDLVYDPMKGGDDFAALFRRVFLGMPGSPMPGSPNLSDRETTDLVRYVQSLSRQPKNTLTNHQRAMRAIGAKYRP